MSKYDLLIDKLMAGSISPDERKDLERWVLENKVNLRFFEKRLKQYYPRATVHFDTELEVGTTKVLNSEGDELITDDDGNIVANKIGSSLAFARDSEAAKTSTMYNEIFIPYGQTFKFKLSDGTLGWLNLGQDDNYFVDFPLFTQQVSYKNTNWSTDFMIRRDNYIIRNFGDVDFIQIINGGGGITNPPMVSVA